MAKSVEIPFLPPEFVRSAAAVYIGIDPGITGAIAVYGSCGGVEAYDLPTTSRVVRLDAKSVAKSSCAKSKRTRRDFDLTAIVAFFDELDRSRRVNPVVCLERPPVHMASAGGDSSQSYSSAVLMKSYAMWPLFLLSRGYRLNEVMPNVWKPKFGLSRDKKVSLDVVRTRFPHYARISRVKDHNRAEAMALAVYASRLENEF